MNQKTFKKVSGKRAIYTSDGVYEFNPLVCTLMNNCCAFDKLIHSCFFELEGFDVHLILASNANYWKTDGQVNAVHLIVHDKTNQASWIDKVICTWDLKGTKQAIRQLKNSDFSKENMNPKSCKTIIKNKKEKQPHQIAF